MYSKLEQWDKLSRDFGDLDDDEELLITLGERQYTVRVADTKALRRHYKPKEATHED